MFFCEPMGEHPLLWVERWHALFYRNKVILFFSPQMKSCLGVLSVKLGSSNCELQVGLKASCMKEFKMFPSCPRIALTTWVFPDICIVTATDSFAWGWRKILNHQTERSGEYDEILWNLWREKKVQNFSVFHSSLPYVFFLLIVLCHLHRETSEPRMMWVVLPPNYSHPHLISCVLKRKFLYPSIVNFVHFL